jgi:asparagine synthetase B (glutamine-hydrolysing)
MISGGNELSWIFSLIKKDTKFKYNEKALSTIHPKAKYTLINKKIYLVAGGNNNMCISNITNSSKEINDNSFVVLGLGIANTDNRFHFVKQNEWYNLLINENIDLNLLNGHFVTILINKKKIIIRNDQLGLRNLYYLETDNFIGISTRLDWLTKVVNNSKINIKSYSSFWNLITCLSYKSFVQGINKLSPGGKLTINENNKIETTHQHWHPDLANNIPGYDPISMLKDLTLFPIDNNQKINLALSGGIDSRTLLSFLLSEDRTKWKTLTLGKKELPDAIIAKAIADHYCFQHKIYYKRFPKTEECITDLYKFVSETYSTLPAYFMTELGYYSSIDREPVFIDGGSGGLFRRVVGNKILFKGRNYFFNKSIENIYSVMRKSKADIFNEDTKRCMHSFSLKTIERMFSDMPEVKDFGIDNWIDLMYIRYSKSIHSTITQSKMDNYLVNYMPFLQPSFLKLVFNINAKIRKSVIMNKKILMENQRLTKFPIVKYNTIIPFTLNLYYAYSMAMISKKVKKYPKPNLDIELLDIITDFVHDRVNSKAVIDHPYYNIKKIRTMINRYYCGNKRYASQLNWWLSYDIWQEIISEKSVL